MERGAALDSSRERSRSCFHECVAEGLCIGKLREFLPHAGISEQVKDKPVGVEILGEKVVLYRDSAGAIQCLADVCPHRGAPLHKVQALLACS